VPLCINTDAHGPSDLITRTFAAKILRASGIEESRIEAVFENSKVIIEKIRRRN